MGLFRRKYTQIAIGTDVNGNVIASSIAAEYGGVYESKIISDKLALTGDIMSTRCIAPPVMTILGLC